MSRTFLISNPTLATMPNDTLDMPPAPPPPPAVHQIDALLDFEEHLAHTPQAQRYALWCLVGRLNAMIIGNLQSHFRKLDKPTEVNQDINYDKMPEDQRLRLEEQDAAIAALMATHEAREEQGFEVPMESIDIAEILVQLRTAVAFKLKAIAFKSGTPDTTQPIAETIAFRLRQKPAVDEQKILTLHLISKIPMEALRRAELQSKTNDRQALLDVSGRIIDESTKLSWRNKRLDDSELEGIFDSLPVASRYRLIGAVVKILNGAMASEVKAFIRFGRKDAIANRLIIESVLNGYVAYLQRFTHDNGDALAAHEERGFPLPTVEELLADRS